jgi:hypothetical protein
VWRYRPCEVVTDYSNSAVTHAINEYIHSVRDRQIMFDRLVDGMSIEKLAEKYDRSTRAMQRKVAKLQTIVFLHIK